MQLDNFSNAYFLFTLASAALTKWMLAFQHISFHAMKVTSYPTNRISFKLQFSYHHHEHFTHVKSFQSCCLSFGPVLLIQVNPLMQSSQSVRSCVYCCVALANHLSRACILMLYLFTSENSVSREFCETIRAGLTLQACFALGISLPV